MRLGLGLGFPLHTQKEFVCVVSRSVLNLMQNGHAVRHLRVLFVFHSCPLFPTLPPPPAACPSPLAVVTVVVVIACSVAYRRLLN